MPHLALYREFRPQKFADVVGQQHITRTLLNAIMQKRLHHAYLLSGPRGTGKTTVARILAKAANCLDNTNGEPCDACSACRSINAGETMDIIEIDAASNRGVDEIRDLREKVRYAPADLTRKVYIIDEVHMLTEPAFNALLKTLEEPPAHVMFVMATTEKQKLPITILSRCQSFEYHRLSTREIIERLQGVCAATSFVATPEALSAIARQADGGMRDALSLLEQVMAFAEENQVTLADTLHVLGSAPLDDFLKLDRMLHAGDVGSVLMQLDSLIRHGKDLRQFNRDFLTHLRDLLLLKVGQGSAVLDLPASGLDAMKAAADLVGQEQLLAAIKLFAQLESDMKSTAVPRLLVEVALIRCCDIFARKESAVAKPTPAPTSSPVTQPVPDTAPESTPAISSASAPAPASLPVATHKLAAVWESVVEMVRKARPSTGVLLKDARIGPLRGNSLTLIAPNQIFVKMYNQPQNLDLVAKAFAKLGHPDLTIQAVEPDHPSARFDEAAESADNGSRRTAERSLVEIARSVFPQELVQEVEEEE